VKPSPQSLAQHELREPAIGTPTKKQRLHLPISRFVAGYAPAVVIYFAILSYSIICILHIHSKK